MTPRIFQIGFNKCGSTSLAQFFEQSGIATRHWDNGRLAMRVHARLMAGEDPIADYPRTAAFMDMIHVGNGDAILEPYKWFPYLHRWYPDALFVLNTRPRENWIKSRLRHKNPLLPRYASYLGLKPEDVLTYWRAEWIVHHLAVRAHFRGNERFLEFNIEQDDAAKLKTFLCPHYPAVEHCELGHHNKSAPLSDPAE